MSDPARASDGAAAPAALPEILGFWHFAQKHPDKPALICEPSGTVVSFGDLDRMANRASHALRAQGLADGDGVSICLPNGVGFVAAMLAALRSGVYFTLIPAGASASDIAYLCGDSGSKLLLIADGPVADAVAAQLPTTCRLLRSRAGKGSGGDWERLAAAKPDTLPPGARPGMEMIYSSGSTGRPKGIRRDFQCKTWGEVDSRNVGALRWLSASAQSVYLSTSPLYHSAPFRFLSAFLDAGATAVLMERFDPGLALDCIEQHGCTHSLWVPTMFSRLLGLAPERRAACRTGSMTHAIHGAAPCPRHVKQAMIDWWGPILYEYYSGTEGIGRTFIDSREWLAHPGSVGRPSGCIVHILGDDGRELPTGQTGDIFFESDVDFAYWNDADKTRQSISPQGWRTFGDIGHVDADGYLYLTDRRSFMLISGGVNIYPREVEDNLLLHPAVQDAAAFGVPDDDLGEVLVAVVQLKDGLRADARLSDEILGHCRHLGGSIKTPKALRFCEAFPRLDNGKVQKRLLRDRVAGEAKPLGAWSVWENPSAPVIAAAGAAISAA